MAKELDIDKMLSDVNKGKSPATNTGTKKFYQQYEKPGKPQTPKEQPQPMQPKSNMPKGGKQSPHGDLGKLRQAEFHKAGGKHFKSSGKDVASSSCLPFRKPRLTNSDTNVIGSVSGPDTMGGIIGGKSDKPSYQGMKAGK